MDLLYSYHKQYVEKYNNIITGNDGVVVGAAIAAGAAAPNNFNEFNKYFIEAVKHLYTSTKDYVYKIFLLYNAIPDIEVRVEERNLSYRAT